MYLKRWLSAQSVGLFVACLFCACSVSSSAQFPETLVGKWKARWLFGDTASLSAKEDLRYDMDGLLHFKEDGKVKLSAYGCPNCIMGKDTIEHELLWEYRSDTLILQNTSDQVDLVYRLDRAVNDTLYFVLLDQIELRLTKLK